MEKHDLHHEFPEFDQQIHNLKVSDNHFRRLFDDYHEVNNEIHRIESGAEATSDETLNQLRLKRVHLKDELYSILKQA
jgi:uncharacterized protein YdcH (DUF465 family)